MRWRAAMRRAAVVEASAASGAAASVALAAAWGQPIPGYGRPGGGVKLLVRASHCRSIALC